MISAVPLTDFTAGELTPKFSARWDLPIYLKGCATLSGWMPFSQGGIITQPGSKHLNTTKNNVLGCLHGWKLPNGVAYMLEFTALVLRFWKSDGTLFGAPLELTTPYTTAANCRALRFAVDGNSLFISCEGFALQQVKWTGATFTIAPAVIVGNTGEIPFSASGDYPGCIVGFAQRLWFGRSTNQPQTLWGSRVGIYTEYRSSAWTASTAYELGDIVSNDTGKLYTCITAGISAAAGGPTGTTADITDGTAHWCYWCASGSIDMTYYERRKYTVEQLKDPTTWVDHDIPELETVTVFRNIVTDDAAMELTLASDSSMAIQELISGKILLVSTSSAEYVVPPDLTALSTEKLQPSTHYGGAAVPGCVIGDSMLFWQKLATRLRAYPLTEGATEESVDDLSYHAEHIFSVTAGTVVEAVIAHLPWQIVYAVRSDGMLCALGYDKKLGFRAWHRLPRGGGGLVQSIGVNDGTSRDAVWAIVLRGTQYCVELFDGIEDMTAIPVDGWVDVATAGATITGLTRFASLTATIWNATEGVAYTAAVSAGGVITTPAACVGDHLVVGAGFTCTMQTMRIPTVGPIGPGSMRVRQVSKVYADVLASYPFKFGRVSTASELDATPWTGAFTGIAECAFRGEANRDTWVMAIQDQPYRSQILGLIAEIDT